MPLENRESSMYQLVSLWTHAHLLHCVVLSTLLAAHSSVQNLAVRDNHQMPCPWPQGSELRRARNLLPSMALGSSQFVAEVAESIIRESLSDKTSTWDALGVFWRGTPSWPKKISCRNPGARYKQLLQHSTSEKRTRNMAHIAGLVCPWLLSVGYRGLIIVLRVAGKSSVPIAKTTLKWQLAVCKSSQL